MKSKVIFLGTGGDSIVLGKQYRSTAGIIIQVEQFQYHLNPGPGSLVRLKENELNPRSTIAVLASNNDILNCNDVNAVIDAMTISGIDRRGVLVGARSVLESSDKSRAWVSRHHAQCVEKLIPLDANSRIGINNVDIVATKTKWHDESAVGFKFYIGEKCIGYVGDTNYFDELGSEFKDSHVLIINLGLTDDFKEESHLPGFSPSDAIELIKQVKPAVAVITNYGVKVLKDDPLAISRNIQLATNVRTLAAKDGLTLNPDSYRK